MASNHLKQIAISPENYEALKKLGSMGSTFDSVLSDVLRKAQAKGDKPASGTSKIVIASVIIKTMELTP